MRHLVLAVVGATSGDEWGDAAVVTVPRDHLAGEATRLLAEGHTRLGVAGSDADVARVAGVAYHAGTRVAIALSARTDLAAMFAQRPEDSAARLAEGSAYRIDLGFVSGAWGSCPFVNAVASGMPAGRVGLSPLSPVRRGPVQVSRAHRGFDVAGAVGVFVMNGQVSGGMTIAPKATPVDSSFDLQVVSAPRHRLHALRVAMQRGLHLGRPDVSRRRASEARITVPDGWPLSADGERIGRGSFGVSLAGGAVDILV